MADMTASQWYLPRPETTPLVDDPHTALSHHHTDILALSNTVHNHHITHTPFRIQHRSTSFTEPKSKSRKSPRGVQPQRPKKLDISHLNRIIHINPTTMTVLVEPATTMSDLLSATLYHGFAPEVVIEFPSITCGGAFSSTSAESSSFRHGRFEDTVVGIEVVLGTGDVIPKAQPRGQHSDLFWGCASGCGSLGVVTLLEIKLVPARPFVRMDYFVCDGIGDAVRVMEREMLPSPLATGNTPRDRRRSQNSAYSACSSEKEYDTLPNYIDAIVFSPSSAVVIVGRLTGAPEAGVPISRFSSRSDPYFYSHVQEIASCASATESHYGHEHLQISSQYQSHGRHSPAPTSPTSTLHTPPKPTFTDAIPLPDYLFRYDRAIFFAGGDRVAKHIHPKSPLCRLLASPFLRARQAVRALRRSGLDSIATAFVGTVPVETGARAASALGLEFGVWPLWMCPTRVRGVERGRVGRKFAALGRRNQNTSDNGGDSRTDDTMAITIGLFGLGHCRTAAQQRTTTRSAIDIISDMGGNVSLTSPGGTAATAFASEDEFWMAYDQEWYEGLRKVYGGEGLGSLGDRIGEDRGFGRRERGVWLMGVSAVFWLLWG